jgi:low affinity Fe/Cu permease
MMEYLARKVTELAGSTAAFYIACLTIIIWAVFGPYCNYSDTYQLVINTGTTIVTFLMVFLIQRTQNKDAMVVQIKLNEILAALKGASSRLINIEDVSEDEVKRLHHLFRQLRDIDSDRHSIEEVIKSKEDNHAIFQ